MSRSENYVEDVPMRLSRKYEPFNFESEPLPDVRSQESLMREFTYEFNTELCALEVAGQRSKEICDQAERVRQKQLQQQELDRLNHHQLRQPIHRQHPVPAPLYSSSSSSSLQVLSNHSPQNTTPSPPAPAHPLPHSIPFTSHQTVPAVQHQQQQLSIPSSHHPHSVPASPQSQIKQSVQVPVTSMGSMSSSVSSGNFMALSATSSSLTNSNIAGPAVMTLTNGGPNATTSPSSSTSSSSSQVSDHNKCMNNGPGEALQLKPINTKEFEDFVGSSPFDDALLRSIDDKQELNSVFANVQQPNNNSPHSFNGPNHSAYNNFNPR